MSTGIGNKGNPSCLWFWNDWDRDTARLTLAEKGLLVDVRGLCVRSATLGEYKGTVACIMGYGENAAGVWRTLLHLATKGAVEAEVRLSGEWVPVTPDTHERWAAALAEELTPVVIRVPELVHREEKLTRERERMRRNRGEPEANSERTDGEQTANSERTDSEPEANSERTGSEQDDVSRARKTSFSSTKRSSSGEMPVEKKKRVRRNRSAEEAMEELRAYWEPKGIDFDEEVEAARRWIERKNEGGGPRRMFTDRFLENWLSKARPAKMKRAAVDGERECPLYDGRVE